MAMTEGMEVKNNADDILPIPRTLVKTNKKSAKGPIGRA